MPDNNSTSTTRPESDATNKWDDSEFHQHLNESWLQSHKREVMAFAGLSMVLVLVIFGLPSVVNAPPSNTDQAQTAAVTSDAPTGPALNESPWQDAQLAKARRAAQEVLAKLLDKQKRLESMSVRLWAANEFDQALALANRGDELYRQRQFTASQTQYGQALSAFDTLIEQAGTLFEASMVSGAKALDEQAPDTAMQAFELATAIRPNNEPAQQGFVRAQSLEQVIIELENASNLEGQQDLDGAKERIKAALAIDAQSKAAQQRLNAINAAINTRDYASAMGQGFDALYQQRFSQADQQFRQALKLKPNDQPAQQALAQTKNQQTQKTIKQHLAKAQALEPKEQWQSAHQAYQAALALDNSLVSARIGGLRTKARNTLDQQLEQAIANPLRLADDRGLKQAQQLLHDAQAIKPKGKKIEGQIQALNQAISIAQQPISVMLRSDNSTQVTLYKVGPLGNFVERTIDLKPGRYTAVGNRKGYRDVREEFTVQADKDNLTIVIQCLDKISLEG